MASSRRTTSFHEEGFLELTPLTPPIVRRRDPHADAESANANDDSVVSVFHSDDGKRSSHLYEIDVDLAHQPSKKPDDESSRQLATNLNSLDGDQPVTVSLLKELLEQHRQEMVQLVNNLLARSKTPTLEGSQLSLDAAGLVASTLKTSKVEFQVASRPMRQRDTIRNFVARTSRHKKRRGSQVAIPDATASGSMAYFVAHLINGSPVSEAEVEEFVDMFRKMSTRNGFIMKSQFAAAVGPEIMACPEVSRIVERLEVKRYDSMRGKAAVLSTMMPTVQLLLSLASELTENMSQAERLGFAFEVLDRQGSGYLGAEELVLLLNTALVISQVQMADESLALKESLVESMLAAGDGEKLSKAQFQAFFEDQSHDEQIPRAARLSSVGFKSSNYFQSTYDVFETPLFWVWVGILFALAVGLYAYKVTENLDITSQTDLSPVGLAMARGAALPINVLVALVLWPVCRRTMTLIRNTPLNVILPFDEVVSLHKFTGLLIGILALLHTAGHIAAALQVLDSERSTVDEVNAVFGEYFNGQRPSVADYILNLPVMTGIIMLVFMFIAYPLSHWTVRKKRFDTFWSAHHLLLLFLVCLAAHGQDNIFATSQSVYWLGFPLLVYTIERVSRAMSPSEIVSAHVHRQVLHLKFQRPKWFKETPGMFVMINIPVLGHFKWHPFTLSSTPYDDHLAVHIKAAGDWTKAAHRLLASASAKNASRTAELESAREGTLAFLEAARARPYPKIYVQRPLGAPAQNFGRFPVVVLVGGGIGATPMISIIKWLLQRQQRVRSASQQDLSEELSDEERPDWPHTVYFHWLTRDTQSFQWFAETMNSVAESDQYDMLRIYNHLTSATPPQKQKVMTQILDVAKNLCISQQQTDLISGLHTNKMTSFGRPDWDHEIHKVLQETTLPLSAETVEIGVFVCGPNKLSSAVRSACVSHTGHSFKFKFNRERF